GNGKEDLFESRAELIGFGETGAGNSDSAHGKTAFVEVGKERASHLRNPESGGDQEQNGQTDDQPGTVEREREDGAIDAFESPNEPWLAALLDGSSVGKQN